MIQGNSSNEIDILPGTGGGSFKILPGIAPQQTVGGFAWTLDGHLLVSEVDNLVRMRPDGTDVTSITSSQSGFLKDTASCNQSRSIVLTWVFRDNDRSGRIWRMNSDGTDAAPVTSGSMDEEFRFCSADGKLLYYSNSSKSSGLLRVSVNGGEDDVVPGSVVPNGFVKAADLSPDGKTVAEFLEIFSPETHKYSNRIQLLDLNAAPGTPGKWIDVDSKFSVSFFSPGPAISANFHFTPDGKALAFVSDAQGISNVWILPLDSSPARQLTNFDSETILDFRWSPDSKQLGVLRYQLNADVILLRDSNSPQ
jgi:dipeptidyl aminopeptidase/acylaminoacyl peptidase